MLQLFYVTLHTTFVALSRLHLGQTMISILDYYMVKIENTLDFCIPELFDFETEEIIEHHRRTLPVKDRPMAWIFFIPALIFLRIFRFVLSVCCIITGNGEVTAQRLQVKVIAFRRYYRSIRHYAVTEYWKEKDLAVMERRKESRPWRFFYRIYEAIFMTKPRVAHHCEARQSVSEKKVRE